MESNPEGTPMNIYKSDAERSYTLGNAPIESITDDLFFRLVADHLGNAGLLMSAQRMETLIGRDGEASTGSMAEWIRDVYGIPEAFAALHDQATETRDVALKLACQRHEDEGASASKIVATAETFERYLSGGIPDEAVMLKPPATDPLPDPAARSAVRPGQTFGVQIHVEYRPNTDMVEVSFPLSPEAVAAAVARYDRTTGRAYR